jgi:hypothetical protein
MNKLSVIILSTGLLGFALATSAVAQEAQFDAPSERTLTASCEAVDWNNSMLDNHPRLIDACQEVIMIDGESWARFDARFKELQRDGHVVFNVLDRRDRRVEEVKFMPSAGQVAYISDRATPFSQLRSTDAISLYVPEGQYGFATQPGVPPEQIAKVVPPARPAPVVTERAVARATPRPTVLPATASPLSWLALAGFLSLFAGLILTLRR